jgi:hypothetical protein
LIDGATTTTLLHSSRQLFCVCVTCVRVQLWSDGIYKKRQKHGQRISNQDDLHQQLESSLSNPPHHESNVASWGSQPDYQCSSLYHDIYAWILEMLLSKDSCRAYFYLFIYISFLATEAAGLQFNWSEISFQWFGYTATVFEGRCVRLIHDFGLLCSTRSGAITIVNVCGRKASCRGVGLFLQTIMLAFLDCVGPMSRFGHARRARSVIERPCLSLTRGLSCSEQDWRMS